jgi:hypothetical protein
MADIRTNIFGIGEVYELQKEGQWVERNRESYREYGYFGGTIGASRLDRIDYSNDTSTGIFRKTIRVYGGATGNSNFGYFGGGYGPLSAVDRVNYSNDTAVEGLRGSLSLARWRFSATGNSNFGYFAGGAKQNVENIVSTVDRINYSNDLATASVRGPLSLPKGFAGSSGNSNFGYYYGGFDGGVPAGYTNIERINYFNDTTKLSVRGLLVAGSGGDSATGNNNFGYIVTYTSTRVHRIDYSNDLSTSVHRAITNYTLASRGATGNSNFGYFGGGYTAFSVVERLDYSNDNTQTSLRGPLSYSRSIMSATSSASFGGSPVSYLGASWTSTAPFGYFGGGYNFPGLFRSTVDRIDYTNDTATALVKGPLSLGRRQLGGTGNQNFGYFGGGGTPGGGTPPVSTVDRIDYSNDNGTASLRGSLTSARKYLTATGNSNFGYFGGGFTFPNSLSVVDRINYSNDTAIASPRGPLSLARNAHSSTGNSNFGYFGSGNNPAVSSVDRIDYSNDTATASPRGPLSAGRYDLAATGNSNFGYFGGGTGATTRLDRVDYANDTITASVRGAFSSGVSGTAATGNSNSGYFGGAVGMSVVNYSNDTQTVSTRGALSLARGGLSASSSQAYGGAPNTAVDPLPSYIRAATKWIDSNTLDLPFKRVLGSYGYFGGGNTGGGQRASATNRVDYSNDLTTHLVRGFLSVAKDNLAATGNSNFGYFGGGTTAGGASNTLERLDFSSDLSNALTRTVLPDNANCRATGNSNFGYFTNTSPGKIGIYRLDYSNDNAGALGRSVLSAGRYNFAATGNSNFGYFGGGGSPSIPTHTSRVDRINYLNDTMSTSIRGPLSVGRPRLAATGNSNFGYFGGGYLGPGAYYYLTIDRIDYTNDTSTASVRGSLGQTSADLSATGNSNFGYFGGGVDRSWLQRLDYSNDLSNTTFRSGFATNMRSSSATTNARSS